MAKFTLEINCDNSAFSDEEGGPYREIARILRELADRTSELGGLPANANLRDMNGNRVGRFGYYD